MNVLASEQLKIFNPSLNENERKMTEEAFNKLYYQLRYKDENSFLGRLSLKDRQRCHGFALLVFTILNKLKGFKCEVIHDRREATSRPIIFALTHIGKFDIEVSALPIKEHFYVLSGDYEHLQGLVDGMFLLFNGVIYFNERVKEDRVAVHKK